MLVEGWLIIHPVKLGPVILGEIFVKLIYDKDEQQTSSDEKSLTWPTGNESF